MNKNEVIRMLLEQQKPPCVPWSLGFTCEAADKLRSHYRGRLTFHGGLSTQHMLLFGSVEDVRKESNLLLKEGCQGNNIFSPAHAVQGDVPLENMLAFIEILKSQPGLE